MGGTGAEVSRSISIHALREERDSELENATSISQTISIHALREERGICVLVITPIWSNFNPRAPRGARRAFERYIYLKGYFNPRAPRGARRSHGGLGVPQNIDFNPRAPRGARPRHMLLKSGSIGISIHALREERDRRSSGRSRMRR